MKTLLKNFLKGICLGTTIFVISIIVGGILIGDISSENISEIIMYIVIVLWLALFIGIGLTLTEKNQNMDFNKRKKILKNSTKILLLLVIVFAIILIISIIKNSTWGIVMSILFIATLFLWLLGSILGYTSLKKDVELINQKLKNRNSN